MRHAQGGVAALALAMALGLAACSDAPPPDEASAAPPGAAPAQGGMASSEGMALPAAAVPFGDASAAVRAQLTAAPAQNLDPGKLPGVGAVQPGMMPGHGAVTAR